MTAAIDLQCVACEGKKKNSRGGKCHSCNGTGDHLAPTLANHRAAFGDADAQLMQAKQALTQLQQFRIVTQEDYALAGDWLTTCQGIIKQNEARRQRFTKPLNAAKREIDTWFKPMISVYEQSRDYLKAQMLDFQAKQMAERRVIAAQMQQQHAQQNTPALMQLAASAQTTTIPQVQGVSTRMISRWRVENENIIPRQYWQLDEKAINAAMKKGENIPGISYYKEPSIAARGKP